MAINVGRDAIEESLNTKSSIADTVNQLDTANQTQVFTRAVVVEVLYDLAAFTDEDIEEMKSLVNVPGLLDSAPRNSIIARIVSSGNDRSAPDAFKPLSQEEKNARERGEKLNSGQKIGSVGVLAYPFFPPHLCLPLKPGEHVWLISDTVDTPTKIMYWMCRVSEPDHVDDVNYTHSDRKFVGSLAPKTTKEKADIATGTTANRQEVTNRSGQLVKDQDFFDQNKDGIDDRLFGFPNGTGQQEAFTLKEEFDYENIVKVSEAYRQFRPQDVPRFTKRPGDLVIQGSNNTLICLGEERGWKKDTDPSASSKSNATNEEKEINENKEKFLGAIDVVAGRGRYNWRFLNQEADTTSSGAYYPPAARVIKNTPDSKKGRASYVEVNKNPQESNKAKKNRLDNPTEGDPDYFSDAARILVAHSSNVDQSFNISTPGETLPTLFAGNYSIVNKEPDYASAIVSKADEIRIVARKLPANEPAPGAPEINGSIRIIKEGEANDDLASIIMLPDGTIQISGSKIYLGRSPTDGGTGGGPGENQSQPYVKYQQLEDLLNKMIENIDAFCVTLLSHTTPGFGAPSPQIIQAAAELQLKFATRKTEIISLKSDRIFGE